MQPDWVKKLDLMGKQKRSCFFVINFDATEAEIYTIDELTQQNIAINFPNFQSDESISSIEQDLIFKKSQVDFKSYQNAFEQVLFHLKRGDTYLTNLTFPTPIEINLNFSSLYSLIASKYKIKFQEKWICFSPETFVKIHKNKIETFPMKGTIDAAIPNAEEILLNDDKEKAEHSTIVDLLRNDLSLVAKNVEVEKLMYLDKIKTNRGEILQMSSKITGNIQENWQENMGSLLFQLLPAGSICGAPKNKTLEIIHHVENYERRYYTGIGGYFDGEKLDTCVLIRFIENQEGQWVYKSGGGITVLSEVKKEFEELNQKVYVPVR